jgi:hypothetical protein
LCFAELAYGSLILALMLAIVQTPRIRETRFEVIAFLRGELAEVNQASQRADGKITSAEPEEEH